MKEFKCLNILTYCINVIMEEGPSCSLNYLFLFSLIINDILFYELFHNKLNIN